MFPDEYLVIVEAIDEKGQRVQVVAFADKEEFELASFPKGSEDVEGLLSVSTLEIKDRLASVVLLKQLSRMALWCQLMSRTLYQWEADAIDIIR